MLLDWKKYNSDGFYDELMSSPNSARKAAGTLVNYLSTLSDNELTTRKESSDFVIKTMGITFTVYSDGENIDRAWPFDIIPRIIPSTEWEKTDKGLKQRLTALNLFIDDIYHDQKILKDRIIPAELILKSNDFRKECMGVSPKFGAWANICGTDLVRDADGTFYVLEDNLRVPSGVAYMLENRKVTKRVFPELFEDNRILPIGQYTNHLYEILSSLSPRDVERPEVVVLTPGIYNSAYFEHSFLAQQMGCELVEGSDLYVADDDCVYTKTIFGPKRVDVIYRRIDDLFLDPDVFNPDSTLGVAGLMRAWKKGNVALANAPGAGVADDKVIYTYVPDMIKYYLDEDPILPNVPSYLCLDKKQCDYVLANLDKLVVKPANGSGGYGMLIGPKSTKAEQERFAELIKKDPRNYMAQPTLSLSTSPTFCGSNIEPRHLDLRPFILQSDKSYVTTGGLTRVAMQKGSLLVNSSQGGGSKDTWIVDMEQ